MTARKASELEKATLQQLLDDLVAKVNGGDDGGHKGSVYGSVVKENCKLKMEVILFSFLFFKSFILIATF